MAPQAGGAFVDLGSGTGKAVLTAAALYPLASARGIEIQPRLHDAALRACARLLATPSTGCQAACPTLRVPHDEVRFELGDALSSAWYEGVSLVFCTPTCFSPEMLAALRAGVAQLRPGARLALTTRAVDWPGLKLLRKGPLPYGKGMLTFFVYERTRSEPEIGA